MKKGSKRRVLFAFLLVLLFGSMAGVVSAFVRINEIMYNPSTSQGSDSYNEWVEIYNNGTSSVDLTNATLCGDSLLKGFINHSDGSVNLNTTFVLEPSKFALITDGGSGATNGTDVYDNFAVDTNALAFHVSGLAMCNSDLKNAGEEINITLNSDVTVVDYTPFVSLFPDTNGTGKTLIFYKGNWTESALVNGTPGATNDQFAPDFNKWANPSSNNSIVGGLFNITVNITDVTSVSSALVDFNGTNSTMQQDNDIWYYLWNTSKNSDGEYNITIFFNDTLGFYNTNKLYYIEVDNTKPGISDPTANANARNFVSKNSAFNAEVNATDANLLNVTCTLDGLTVGNSSKAGDVHSCSLTAPSTENDFEITFTAIDRAGNTNTTKVNFTTKYSTTASLSPRGVTVFGLNQSDKIVQVNATLSNADIGSMYDTGIILDSFFPLGFASASISSYKSCSPNINNSQNCNVTINITVKGGLAADTYTIYWDANWTNSNFTNVSIQGQDLPLPTSTITINSNPQITTTENLSITVNHGESNNLSVSINSTGNADLQNVITTFIGDTLDESYITFTPSTFTSISAATNKTSNATITIPKYTSPGNYTGTIYVNASNAENKTILLTVVVLEDSSWTTSPTNVTVYKRTDNAGLTTTISLNNSGNIGQKYSIASAGLFKSYIWDGDLNPTSIYVERNTTEEINIYHLANGPKTSYDLTLTITSLNTSATNRTYINLTRDNANPFLNITSPLNNSFVKGIVEFNVSADDLNLSRIEYKINDELVLSSYEINFTFKWDTANGNYPDNEYTLKAIAYDSAGNSNTSYIDVTLNNTDSNPVLITNITDIALNEGATTTINLSNYFKSIDGDNLNYSSTTPDNITVSINNTNTTVTLTAKEDFFGIRYIIFYANDTSENVTASNTVTINVTNINDAPTIPALVSPLNNSNVTSSAGNALLSWNSSIDADNDSITYYVFLSNYSANIAFNATTTATSLQLTNLDANETYYWNVLANDSLLSSSKSGTFNFTMIRDNNPRINAWTWNNTINVSTNTTPNVAENKTLSFKVNASDPDGNAINFTWYLDNVNVSYVQNFTLNFTENFTAAGSYTLKLEVQDNNSNSAEQEWTVTVTDTNRAPVLYAITNKEAVEDIELKFNITASDPDGDTLTYTSNQSNITITKFNNTVATISWKPINDYVGNNTIEFIVKDSAKNDSKTIVITVNNTNDAPTITSPTPTVDKTIAEVVGVQTFSATFGDVDVGDQYVIFWMLNGSLLRDLIIPGPNPSLSVEDEVNVTNQTRGIYNVTALVQDDISLEARYMWTLTVTTGIIFDGLTSPILEGLNQSQRENVTDVMVNHSTFGGIDFGSKTMNFSRVANLEDAVNISRGLISVDTDTYPELKNKSASLAMKGLNYTKAPLIYNASGFKNTNGNICPEDICTNITYDVANGILRFNVPHFSTYYTGTNTTNGAPIITSTPVTKATERAQYTYDVGATDPDGDTLIFSLITGPSGMSISSSSGIISWTPAIDQLGVHNVNVSASDSNLTTEQSFQITVGKGPRLIISDLDIKVDGKTDKNVQNNTKIGKEAAPGSRVEFKLKIENLFTRDEDLEIKNIETTITIEDIDDGDDLDEDAKDFDLKSGKKENIDIDFNIPLEVEEDIYNVIINVEGEDENRTTHTIRWELELEVEKDDHEIRIIRSALTPSVINCQRQISLNTEIINTGTKDEDDVTLKITSPELGISSLTTGIELDEGTDDNRLAKLITPSISADVAPGVYPIVIDAYYDSTLSESKTVDLTVEDCELVKKVKEEVKEKKPEVEVIMPPVTIAEKPVAEVSFAGTDTYNTLLAILIVIFLGTAVFVIGAGYIILRK